MIEQDLNDYEYLQELSASDPTGFNGAVDVGIKITMAVHDSIIVDVQL